MRDIQKEFSYESFENKILSKISEKEYKDTLLIFYMKSQDGSKYILKDKIKEIAGIAILTVVASIVSIVISDLIIYPLTIFSMNNVDVFNSVFKFAVLFLLILFIAIKIYRSFKRLKNNNTSFGNIIAYFSIRPFHYITLFFALLIISSFLIFLIYFLYSLNYYYLYKISGGI